MKWKICQLVAFIAIVTALTGCEDKKLDKEFDRTKKSNEIIVYIYPNKESVTDSYEEWTGTNDGLLRDGWATWNPVGSDKYFCEIHVTEPRSVKDTNAMETWGHELAHCMYGRYHAKGQR